MKAIINSGSDDVRMSCIGVGETEAEARDNTARSSWSGKPVSGGECVDVSDQLAEAITFVRSEDARHDSDVNHKFTFECGVLRNALGYVMLRDGVLDFEDNAVEDVRAHFEAQA